MSYAYLGLVAPRVHTNTMRNSGPTLLGERIHITVDIGVTVTCTYGVHRHGVIHVVLSVGLHSEQNGEFATNTISYEPFQKHCFDVPNDFWTPRSPECASTPCAIVDQQSLGKGHTSLLTSMPLASPEDNHMHMYMVSSTSQGVSVHRVQNGNFDFKNTLLTCRKYFSTQHSPNTHQNHVNSGPTLLGKNDLILLSISMSLLHSIRFDSKVFRLFTGVMGPVLFCFYGFTCALCILNSVCQTSLRGF